jgi:CheY-like chemotaxis protein
MTVSSYAVRGFHAVQFYEGERFLHAAIATYLADAVRRGEPVVMIARRRTFEAVAERVGAGHGLEAVDAAGRIMFFDAEVMLQEIMDGVIPDPVRFERALSALIAGIREWCTDGMIWMYGEMVDVLCRAGNHAGAARLEECWNASAAGQRVSVMCGYAIDNFDDDVNAGRFRTICRQHTQVIPTEGFTDAPDDRTKCERVALLQQRTRALEHMLAPESSGLAEVSPGLSTSTVYIVDDDASVRRSLARLLAAVDLTVQTFGSAEAFLAEVDWTSRGCLIVDVQLIGMTGPDLQGWMSRARQQMPVIAMSGSEDVRIEAEALRLGARAFLLKPFDAQALIDEIGRALS